MGRHYWNKKQEADYLKKIEIWWLKKYGYLKGGWKSQTIKWSHGSSDTESSVGITVISFGEDQHLRITYTQTDQDRNKKDFDYKIPLTTSPCNYGSKRYWFICPWYKNGQYCGRRVGVLYKGGNYFACRYCYELTYESRNENRRYKMYPLFSVLSDSKKTEDLEHKIKRRYYTGKPTRKQKRLEKIHNKIFYNHTLMRERRLL